MRVLMRQQSAAQGFVVYFLFSTIPFSRIFCALFILVSSVVLVCSLYVIAHQVSDLVPYLQQKQMHTEVTVQSAMRNDSDLCIRIARFTGCHVRERVHGLMVVGTARSIARYLCWCWVYSVGFVSYSLKPQGASRMFCLQVVV